jgi:hypothetical protein
MLPKFNLHIKKLNPAGEKRIFKAKTNLTHGFVLPENVAHRKRFE